MNTKPYIRFGKTRKEKKKEMKYVYPPKVK